MENTLRIRAATKPSIDEGLKDGMELVNPSGESRTEAQKRRAASQKDAALIATSSHIYIANAISANRMNHAAGSPMTGRGNSRPSSVVQIGDDCHD